MENLYKESKETRNNQETKDTTLEGLKRVVELSMESESVIREIKEILDDLLENYNGLNEDEKRKIGELIEEINYPIWDGNARVHNLLEKIRKKLYE